MTIALPDPISAPVVETTTTASPVEEIPAIDPALLAAMTAIAKAALTEALRNAPGPAWRPGSVQGVNAAERTASVLVDGDDLAITVQVVDNFPGYGDRVFVRFVDGTAVLDGNITSPAFAVGMSGFFNGPITSQAGATVGSATPGFPPPGWLLEDGSAVSRSTYAALFRVIGTTHGSGDGSTTFNLPDSRGRMKLGLDNSGGTDAGRLSMSNTLGGTGGAETHTLSITNLPSHDHGTGSYAVSSHTHDLANHTHDLGNHTHTIDPPTNGTLYTSGPNGGGSGNTINNTGSTTTSGPSTNTSGTPSNNTSGSASPGLSGTSGATGGGTSVNHLPPYILGHWCIKY